MKKDKTGSVIKPWEKRLLSFDIASRQSGAVSSVSCQLNQADILPMVLEKTPVREKPAQVVEWAVYPGS